MRLVSAVLFVALTGTAALADDAKPADSKPDVMRHKVPFRVVKMLPETGQVLLFDRDRGSHVVAEVGQTIDGYRVDDLDDETVTLLAENGTEIILAAPPPPRPARRSRPASDEPSGTSTPTDTASAPPAATSSAEGPGVPVDPYAEPAPPARPGEGGVRVASAAPPATALVEDDPYADPGIAAFADAVGATPAPATPARSAGTAPSAPAGAGPAPTGTSPAPTGTSPAPTGTSPAPTTTSSLAPGPAPTTTSSLAPGPTPTTTSSATSAPGPAPTATTSTSPAPSVPTAKTDDTGAALASALTGAPGPADSTASVPPSPPPPDLSSLDETSASNAASATLPRAELDAALADFSTLAASFRATFTPTGLRFDAIREGTLLTRIGLRKGDVITSVDGKPLRSLDDAANLYARASSLRAMTIQLTRTGKPITLRVAIR